MAGKSCIIREHVRWSDVELAGIFSRVLPLLALAAASGCRAGRADSLYARLILPPHDTLWFTAVARAQPCAGGRGLLLEGADAGNGVLLWLRAADSVVAGDYPVLALGDTVAPRGVTGAVRFMVKTADRGMTFDSGTVTVSLAGGRIDARARGSGIDAHAGQRGAVDASFTGVAMAADTASCRVQLRL